MHPKAGREDGSPNTWVSFANGLILTPVILAWGTPPTRKILRRGTRDLDRTRLPLAELEANQAAAMRLRAGSVHPRGSATRDAAFGGMLLVLVGSLVALVIPSALVYVEIHPDRD